MGAPTPADIIRSHQLNALKLRVVNHKYAARIARHARADAKTLIKLRVHIQTEAVALAGPDYATFHGRLGFEPYASTLSLSPTPPLSL